MQILVVGSENVCNATECIIAVQGHFRVNQDFGTNRMRIFDFLLVINSNLCRILHRFGGAALDSAQSNSAQPNSAQLISAHDCTAGRCPCLQDNRFSETQKRVHYKG